MPSNQVLLSFGDIILVPFPFTDQTASKKRPAVIISSEQYNAVRPDFIIMAITSQLRPQTIFGDAIVTGWQAAGLLKPSTIKPVIATIEQSLTIKQLGRLEPVDIQTLKEAMAAIVGL